MKNPPSNDRGQSNQNQGVTPIEAPGMTDERRRPRRRARGKEAWRLKKDARTMACEVRRDERAGGAWVVILSLDGEWQFGCRCPTRSRAQFAAETLKQDHLRGGWAE
jgi:hypothetical protein